VGPRGGTTHIKTKPPILRNLHNFFLFEQQWANQIGFGPKFWHTLFMRANISEASLMDNFGFKPVRTAGTHFFIDSNKAPIKENVCAFQVPMVHLLFMTHNQSNDNLFEQFQLLQTLLRLCHLKLCLVWMSGKLPPQHQD
jgi:hypothetical protein